MSASATAATAATAPTSSPWSPGAATSPPRVPTLLRVKRTLEETTGGANGGDAPSVAFLVAAAADAKRRRCVLAVANVPAEHLVEAQSRQVMRLLAAPPSAPPAPPRTAAPGKARKRGLDASWTRAVVVDVDASSAPAPATTSGAVALNGERLQRVAAAGGPSASGAFDAEMDEALWRAAAAGQFGDVLRLVETGGRDPDARRALSADGALALTSACRWGNLDAVRRLLEAGADPDLADGYGLRPLDHARVSLATRDPHLLEQVRAALEVAARGARTRAPPPQQPSAGAEKRTRVVFDLYWVDEDGAAGTSGGERGAAESAQGDAAAGATFFASAVPGVLALDPTTGMFVELVHDVADDGPDAFEDEETDSNAEDYYFDRMMDEDDEDDEDEDDDELAGTCRARRAQYGGYDEDDEDGDRGVREPDVGAY